MKRLVAIGFLVTAFAGSLVPTAGADRHDNTITITCVDFLGTTYQVVDVHAGPGIALANANYTNYNGFGGVCGQ